MWADNWDGDGTSSWIDWLTEDGEDIDAVSVEDLDKAVWEFAGQKV